jgi:periplasmic divalent cation tolerance protein
MANAAGARGWRKASGTSAAVAGRGLRVVLATAPARSAPALARGLVRARLAACVNLLPGGRSIYRWRGRIETARETLLIAKTTSRRVRACLRALALAHPYEVPEGLAFEPAAALAAYAGWVDASTR